eukprot:m.51163 g.51163  ORF g.51163 m.51163 type:complete len:223 (-) comp48245_c0_seq1:585-1253(-)
MASTQYVPLRVCDSRNLTLSPTREDGSPDILKTELKLAGVLDGKVAFTLDHVLSARECETFLAVTEAAGYTQATVNVGGGREMLAVDYRNSGRCIIDSVDVAAALWQRIQPFVPPTFCARPVLGLNERLRFLRYGVGQDFKQHQDGSFVRDNGERSFMTLMLYLNDDCDGGTTSFYSWDGDSHLAVAPARGRVLVFQHDLLHSGDVVNSGLKYAMRTDVMFS